MRTFLTVTLSLLTAIRAPQLGAQIVRNTPSSSGAEPLNSGVLTAADLSVLDRARSAQIEFEAFRHTGLPKVMSRRPPDCSERVGKNCYWYAEGNDLPPEPKDITKRREQLLRELETLGSSSPGLLWITEQRVRYLVESDRYRDALEVARGCAGEGAGNGWRCEILVGFAHHMLGDYVAAERTYDSALGHMGPVESCAWRDMTLLLDDVSRAQYRNLRCGDPAREAWAARTWFFARTLYGMPGNDSRTEYFARMTMVQMIKDAPGPFQKGFNDDERETLLRFGWPRSWASEYVLPFSVGLADSSIIPRGPGTSIGVKGKGKGGTTMGSYPPGTKIPSSMPPLTRPPDIPKGPLPGNAGGAPDAQPQLPRIPGVEIRPRDDDGISIVGMEAVPAYRYIPAGFVLNDPVHADSAVWRQNMSPVIARYAPAYAKQLLELDHQQAVFKRGDSAIVVMAYDTRGNPAVAKGPLRAALVVTPGGETPRDFVARREDAPASGVLTVRAPWGPLLMSAELSAPQLKGVARARYGIGPAPGPRERVTLSNLLLYRSSGGFPGSVEEVAPHALPTERVRAKEKLGVYWEAYGTDPTGEKVHVNVIVLRESESQEGGLFGRLGRAIGGKRDATPVSISVDDLSARGSSTSARALALDISTLAKGSYIVQVEITVAGQSTLRTERRIEVTGP